MKYYTALLSILFTFILSSTALAESTPTDSLNNRKWYVPSHITLNYAGHQGLFALGTGLTFGRKLRSNFEITFGYAPESVVGSNLKSLHFKYTYKVAKMEFKIPERLEFYPLNPTIFLNWARLTSEGRMDKSLYHNYYYWWTSNTRIEFGLGQSWKYYFADKSSGSLEFYYEFLTMDLYMNTYFNDEKVKIKDIFFLGMGLRYFF